jgi:hypothetical protein
MDAIVGKFKVRMDRGSVVLTHPTGISFDLTPEEALGFGDIIKVYRETLLDTVHKQQEEPQKNLYKDREPVLQFRSGEQNGKN